MCLEFKYLITVTPLGTMYASAGGFLSPENLVGRSRAKFPPDAATLSGLILSEYRRSHPQEDKPEIWYKLFVTGPFWAKKDNPTNFFVPIPQTKILGERDWAEWYLDDNHQWQKQPNNEIKPFCQWQSISSWPNNAEIIYSNKEAEKSPWEYIPILHPYMKDEERHVKDEDEDKDGLFLEYAVQMPENTCLVYLSTESIEPDWYRFGGENHLVEINSIPIEDEWLLNLFRQPVGKSFALITPALWGNKYLSERYPLSQQFSEQTLLLTDKPLPYRTRLGGRMGRGRYAVPAGSVYVLKEPLNLPWYDWPEDWFPREGFSLKQIGCALALPLSIQGVSDA